MTVRSVTGEGAHLSLALCNTVGSDGDQLTTTDQLAQWYVAVGCTEQPPTVDADELAAVRALRDGLRAAFLSGDRATIAELARRWLEDAPGCLGVDTQSLEPHFVPGDISARCLTVPVVLDALDLARETPARVRLCAARDCGALFLDVSRNRSRRWCSMERCGARAKSSAYYRRRRADERV